MTLVTEIGPVIDRFPVLITQHMPPTFTTILAEHLARSSHRPAHEAVDGEIVKAGQIYLAPGGRHMRVVRHGADVVIALDDGPPVNFCKPAVDPLFTSAIDVWQGAILAAGADGHGLGRHARRQGHRRGRRQRDRPGRSHERGVGNAGRGRQCRHLRGHPAAQSDRTETGPIVFGRSLVTPLDYEFLRKLLKERSGLDLSADKQYLVESRLMPLARKVGLAGIPELVQKMKVGRRGADVGSGRGDDHQRDLLLPRQDPVRSSARDRSCRRCCRRARAAAPCASGARPRPPGRSRIRSRCA